MVQPIFTPSTAKGLVFCAAFSILAIPHIGHAQSSATETPSGAGRTWKLTDSLPNDTSVIVGTLPNGMRYYIRHNKKPEQRAELRLAVKAGSLMEDESQRGLAHWTEHMAFNGTTHFKKNSLIEYLQSIGVRFGADLNAYTSFGETVYILPVPTDTLAQVKQAFQILEDWAPTVTLDPTDFEAERGVILSERRTRLGVSSRLSDQQIPVLFKGSRYVDRLPIGTKESLERAKHDDIVRFYREWYRPDLMAVIAVGDFDAKQMEQMIREQFSNIPVATGPTPRPTYPVPPHAGTTMLISKDPELTGTQVQVIYKGPANAKNTVAAERDDLRRGLFSSLINQRLTEIIREPDAPFVQASIGFDELAPDVSAAMLSAVVADNETQRGLDALLTELTRVVQHGFTQTELDRAKQRYLAQIDYFYQNRNDRNSGEFVGAYLGNFLTGTAYPSAEMSVDLIRHLITGITVADVNQLANFFKQRDNRVLIVSQPEKTGIETPDTAALLASFDRIASQSVAAYTDKTVSNALLPTMPVAGKIVSEKKHDDVGVIEWKLSNGAIVFVKQTKFKASEILFAGTSPGGTSLFPTESYPTAAFTSVVGAGGWGEFSQANLDKKLSGKIASVNASLGTLSEGVSGYTTWNDIETMLQLLHLVMLNPRYDSAAIKSVIQRSKVQLVNRSASPEAVFQDTISATISRYSPRAPLLSAALLDRIDAKKAFALYKERFADASDFAFMFVGAVNPDSLKPFVEKYLASLPTLNRKEKPKDLPEAHPPTGITKRTVVAGREDRSVTILNFSGKIGESSRQELTDLGVMTGVLENRLVKRLREELGGTYGVGAGLSRVGKPISTYSIGIQFIAETARREELIAATFAVIDSLKRVPPSEDEIHRVVETSLRAREKARRTNQYWFGVLEMYATSRPFGELLDDVTLKSVTPAQIQKAAQRYIDIRQYQEFNLVPATTTPATSTSAAPTKASPTKASPTSVVPSAR